MAVKLGLDAVLKVGGSEIKNCRDLTLNIDTATADVSTRGSGGWRANAATLKDASIEFEMAWDTEDAGFVMIREAFLDNETLAVSVEDGDGDAFKATCMVTGFAVSQPLEEAITVSVTMQPAYDAQNPPEWVEGGTGGGTPPGS